MKRVLVTGAGGFLGERLLGALSVSLALEPVALLHHEPGRQAKTPSCSHEVVDLVDRPGVCDLVAGLRPEVIIHTAALTDVDRCETEPELAWRVNACGTAHLAAAAAAVGALLVYISTDYVFDGRRGLYREGDLPHPCNWYGVTKRAGEIAAVSGGADHAILRTTFFGMRPDGKGLFNRVVETCRRARIDAGADAGANGGRGAPLDLVLDQFSSPLSVSALARGVAEVAERGLTGLFHMGGTTRCNRYEFALAVAHELDLPKDETDRLLRPVMSVCGPDHSPADNSPAVVRGRAVRPADVSLLVGKAQGTLGCSLPSLDEGVREEVRQGVGPDD